MMYSLVKPLLNFAPMCRTRYNNNTYQAEWLAWCTEKRHPPRVLVIYVEYMTTTGHTRDSFFSIKPIELSHAKIYIPPRAIVLGERDRKKYISLTRFIDLHMCVSSSHLINTHRMANTWHLHYETAYSPSPPPTACGATARGMELKALGRQRKNSTQCRCTCHSVFLGRSK